MATCEMLIPDEKRKCSRNCPKRNPSGEWLSRMKWPRSPSSCVRMKHPSSPARITPWMAVFLTYEANPSIDLQLKDKVVIVTGGAKGIGAAITRALAQERAVPVILDRDTAAAESLRTELSRYGSVSHFIEIDLCSAAGCATAIERTLSVANRLNALVNNAGVNDGVGLEKGGPEEFAASLGRNLLHYYNMAHYALPSLKAAKGTIVNIASKVAFTGQGGTSGYAASKGAILALTR